LGLNRRIISKRRAMKGSASVRADNDLCIQRIRRCAKAVNAAPLEAAVSLENDAESSDLFNDLFSYG
jgi:hypothetical protein